MALWHGSKGTREYKITRTKERLRVSHMKHFEDYTEDITTLSNRQQKIVQDEIGKVYNYLTIRSFACRNRHELYFNCICECGNERLVKLGYLKNGHQKSCGCKRGQFEPGELERDDLTGQKFGLWTVLSRDTSRTDVPYYLCRCACGIKRSIKKYDLKRGTSWHCGCQKENVKEEAGRKFKERFYNEELDTHPQDLSGRRFGRLVVIEKLSYDRDATPRHKVPYRCLCDCGNETTATYANLMSGDTKSCGCKMREIAERTIKTAQARQEYPEETSISSIKSALRGVVSRRNTTGVRGVTEVKIPVKRGKGESSSWSSRSSRSEGEQHGQENGGRVRYKATIGFKKQYYQLGTYDTLEMATKARKKAEDELYGTYLDAYEGSDLQAEVREENHKKLKKAMAEIREFCQNEERESKRKGAVEKLVAAIKDGQEWRGSDGALWSCIAAWAGQRFTTSGRGKEHRGAVEFTYEIKISSRTGEKTDELIISTRPDGKTITRSSVELALERYLAVQEECGYVKGPKAAGQIFGASYLYAVFLKWGIITDSPVSTSSLDAE